MKEEIERLEEIAKGYGAKIYKGESWSVVNWVIQERPFGSAVKDIWRGSLNMAPIAEKRLIEWLEDCKRKYGESRDYWPRP